MVKSDDKRLLKRLYNSQDGKDFVEEYLVSLQQDNYAKILESNHNENRAELVGYGQCIAQLIKVFRSTVDNGRKQQELFDI